MVYRSTMQAAGSGAERKPGEHIGLPVRLQFHARRGLIGRQQLER
jgi:hypothetical protein